MSKTPRVPPTTKQPVMYGFVCGCVAAGTRDNRVQTCDGTDCKYTPRRPPGARTYRA